MHQNTGNHIYQIKKILGEDPQTRPTPPFTSTFALIGGGRSLCFFAEGDSSSQSIPVLMQFIMWYGIQFVNNHLILPIITTLILWILKTVRFSDSLILSQVKTYSVDISPMGEKELGVFCVRTGKTLLSPPCSVSIWTSESKSQSSFPRIPSLHGRDNPH